jgi:hypothetical protein
LTAAVNRRRLTTERRKSLHARLIAGANRRPLERDRRKPAQGRVIRNKTVSPIVFYTRPPGGKAGGESLNLIGRVLGSRCVPGRFRDSRFTGPKADHVLVPEDRQNVMAGDRSGLKQADELPAIF